MVLLKALRDYVSEQNSNVIKEALGKVSGETNVRCNFVKPKN